MTMTRTILRPLDSRVRAKRIGLLTNVVVESRTLGAPMVYNLDTENLSRTGILLHAGKNKKVPYRVNTILELTVDPRGSVFERPVSCLGKIVRVGQDEASRPLYGVHIVQMDVKDVAAWEATVAILEAQDQVAELPAAG